MNLNNDTPFFICLPFAAKTGSTVLRSLCSNSSQRCSGGLGSGFCAGQSSFATSLWTFVLWCTLVVEEAITNLFPQSWEHKVVQNAFRAPLTGTQWRLVNTALQATTNAREACLVSAENMPPPEPSNSVLYSRAWMQLLGHENPFQEALDALKPHKGWRSEATDFAGSDWNTWI